MRFVTAVQTDWSSSKSLWLTLKNKYLWTLVIASYFLSLTQTENTHKVAQEQPSDVTLT